MHPGVLISVRESTDVAAARRAVMLLAEKAALSSDQASNAGIVVTEAASNVLKHGGGGEIVLRRAGSLIEVCALDKGPGTGSGTRCYDDGYSTAGSPGTGLGAVSRLSQFTDLYSFPGGGAVLIAHVGGTTPDGIVNVPYPGEQACGDAWHIGQSGTRLRVMVVDGLGHGLAASEAAHAALEAAGRNASGSIVNLIDAMHLRLRSTRGAAASVADVQADGRSVEFAGAGNVVGVILPDAISRRQMISSNGTLGLEVRKVNPLKYPLGENSLLVLHSDGLSANWSLDKYPGLFTRHPAVIAAVLFRDFRRQRDDATVVVVRINSTRLRGSRP